MPGSSEPSGRDDRVTFAEIAAAAVFLDFGDIPVDLLSRIASQPATSETGKPQRRR
jgi:hypothetical protein